MKEAMQKWLKRHQITFSTDTANSICSSLGLDGEKVDECLGLCYQLEKGDINEADFTGGLSLLTGKKPEEVMEVLRVGRITQRILTGYRGGELRPTTGASATEGEGLYVSSSKEFAEGFGKVSDIRYFEPRNPLVVSAIDELPVLQETTWMTEPIKHSDSPWVKVNKQAMSDLELTDETFQENVATFNKRLTELIRIEGHDAVKVMSGSPGGAYRPEFLVLLDESLWKDVTE